MLQEEMAALLNGRLTVDGAGTYRVDVATVCVDSKHGDDWWLSRCSVVIMAASSTGELTLAHAISEPILEGQTDQGRRYAFDDEGMWHDLLEEACHHAQATLILLGSTTRLTLLGVCDVSLPPSDPLGEPDALPSSMSLSLASS